PLGGPAPSALPILRKRIGRFHSNCVSELPVSVDHKKTGASAGWPPRGRHTYFGVWGVSSGAVVLGEVGEVGVVALGGGPLPGVMSLEELLLLDDWLWYCCILLVQVALMVASERPSFLAFSFATQFCIHESLDIVPLAVWASAVALAAARPSAS